MNRTTRRGIAAAALFTMVWSIRTAEAGGPPTVALRTVLPGSAGLSDLVHVTHASPEDARLFLVEQEGRVQILRNERLNAEPFLDITDKVAAGGERGLLSIAFHPDFPIKPYCYVYYTSQERTDAQIGDIDLGDILIERYTVSASQGPDKADPASGRVLIRVPHSDAGNHNGGQVMVGPDRKLYFATGDGGGGCDSTGCNAQRDTNLLGKVVRLDIDQNENTPPYYGIPADNPFATAGDPRNKVWAKGLRNPYRFSFDRQTGDLWIGDVGDTTREEVNRQLASSDGGENYGWKIMEGTSCNTCSLNNCPGGLPACNAPALTMPIHDYDRDTGTTVIGGYVYRGTKIAGLQGYYVFADIGRSKLWAFDPVNRERFDLPNTGGITSFGEDKDGELYITSGGTLRQLIVPGDPGPPEASAETTPAVTALVLLALGLLFARHRATARA